jgi:lipopolysaccharide transport system permease protein
MMQTKVQPDYSQALLKRTGRNTMVQRIGYLFTVARLLLQANLRSRHRRSVLGYLWLAIPGIAFAFAFSMLRKGELLAVGKIDMPYPVFVMSGVFLWQTFVDALSTPTQKLIEQQRFLSLVPAPFQAVLLAALGEVMLNLAIRLGILFLTMMVFALPVHMTWLLVPVAGVCMVAAGFVLCLFSAPFAQLYDDVAGLVGMAATFGIFLVPVFYPVPADSWITINPLAWPLMTMRDAMTGDVSVAYVLLLLLLSLLLMIPALALNIVSRPHIAARAN